MTVASSTNTAKSTSLTLRSVLPLAASMIAVFGALIAQQVVIDAAQRRRER